MKISNDKFKLCITVVALLFAGAFNAVAQKAEFGVRFMPTFSSLDLNTSSGGKVSGDLTLGYGFGAILGFNFTDHVGIQVEGIYNNITQKYKENDEEREVELRYFNVPLLLSYNTGKLNPVNFNIVAGPQMGLSVGSSISGVGTDSSNAVVSVKKGDVGLAYGAGVDFGLNEMKTFRLGIGFRGVYGLFDVSDNNNNTSNESYYVLDRTHIKTYSGYIGLSYLF